MMKPECQGRDSGRLMPDKDQGGKLRDATDDNAAEGNVKGAWKAGDYNKKGDPKAAQGKGL